MIYAIFNGHDLNSGGSEVLTLENNPPAISVDKYELVRSDGAIITGQSFGTKKIGMTGRLKASNRKDLDQKLDAFKSWFAGVGKNLDIYVADVTRRYVVTLENMSTTTSGYQCDWIITMTADAFGKDIVTTALTLGTFTDGNEPYTNTITGSYKAKPTIDFTVNQAEPYWQAKYIDFDNTALAQKIRLTRTWNWFDRVVINGEAKTCSLYASSKSVIDLCDVTTGWTSSDTLTLDAVNMKEGVGCLKNVMTGARQTCDFIRLNATAIDLSATMGKIIIPVFIPTPVAGAVASVKLYTGSDATLASNYSLWTVTTQWNGTALATNAWNYVVVDLSTGNTDTGTPTRTAIKSIKVTVYGTSATMNLNNVLLDYITLQKAGVTATTLDYEGIYPELDLGSSTITVTDELTTRNITITGEYTKRWL